jgi:hypothetical protein
MRLARFVIRFLAMSLYMYPLAFWLMYSYANRDRTVTSIFSGPLMPLLLPSILLGLWMLRSRRRHFEWIDRRIFRMYSFQPSLIKAVPGWRLRNVAELFFSARTYREVFEPTLRDLFDEYCEALAANRPWKALRIRLQGYWSFWSAILAQFPISTTKMVLKIWKATR